jgi:hypothetical protein
MLSPVLGALGKFFVQELAIQVWPEEIPRWDTSGNPINPQATGVSPTIWPVVQIVMESRVTRDNTFEDSYSEEPPLTVTAFGTTREQVDGIMGDIEASLVYAPNWAYQGSVIGLIFQAMGYPQFWLYDLEVGSWQSQQMRDTRLAGSQLCWQADMTLKCGVHGSVPIFG